MTFTDTLELLLSAIRQKSYSAGVEPDDVNLGTPEFNMSGSSKLIEIYGSPREIEFKNENGSKSRGRSTADFEIYIGLSHSAGEISASRDNVIAGYRAAETIASVAVEALGSRVRTTKISLDSRFSGFDWFLVDLNVTISAEFA